MKLFNILTAGVLLCAGLASCEMKDELKGSSEGSSDMGYLDLGVAVNASQNNVSRAGDVTDEGKNENVGVSIPTGDFPVIITNVDNPSDPIEYESFDQLKEENKDGIVALPVGTYTVTAHSNDILEGEMDVPYYEGTEEINITKDVKSETHVVCTMKNTKIALSYDSKFIANFTDWIITVTDGTTVLTFECTDNEDVTQLNPAPKYMWVADGVSQLTVHASGYNLKGEFVSEERVLTKPAGGNSANWTGGDALTITMEENTPADPTGVQGSGITITADVEFDESDATIDVPVTPGEDGGDDNKDPEPPVTDNKPTMTLPGTDGNITYTLNGNDMPTIANVEIKAPAGISSLWVTIDAGNDKFANTLSSLVDSGLNFTSGVEMVDNPIITGVLSAFLNGEEIAAPATGETSYSFPIHAFFSLMNFYGATAPESHVFKMILKDNAGETIEKELSVTINSAE